MLLARDEGLGAPDGLVDRGLACRGGDAVEDRPVGGLDLGLRAVGTLASTLRARWMVDRWRNDLGKACPTALNSPGRRRYHQHWCSQPTIHQVAEEVGPGVVTSLPAGPARGRPGCPPGDAIGDQDGFGPRTGW